MTAVNYRAAGPADLDAICGLTERAVESMKKQNIYQWDELYPAREDFQEDIEKGQLFAGEVQGRIAVIYVLNQECGKEYQNGSWRPGGEPFCVLHRLCVDPDFQHRGIAKNALKHAEEKAMAGGFRSVRLDVFSENPFALGLYRSAGYSQTGYADWRKGRFYLMEKQICPEGELRQGGM